MSNEYYDINISTEDDQESLIDGIKSLGTFKPVKSEKESVIVTEKLKKTKKEKKSKKKSFLMESFDIGDDDTESSITYDDEIDEETLLDVDKILMESREEDEYSSIIKEQKHGYKKLKKDENDYKKEFAEELTLLYNLLDETSKFGKSLEKDLSALKGSKVRGVSKYTNDLAELILSSKQNKLNILKEIAGIKKTIADLKNKADNRKEKSEDTNSSERLAAAYFKNILSHGRSNFINTITPDMGIGYNTDDDYVDMTDHIDRIRNNNYEDEDQYSQLLLDRLNSLDNPYRSEAGSKYIEYENSGVKLYVRKCIDTGEWEFIAIDKNRKQINDYPLPSKRDAGRMKFSDDGTYASDSKGRIYNVIEYYLPTEE